MVWKSNTPIFVYGAGLKGHLIADFLINIGAKFIGYLDVNADAFDDDKIYAPDDMDILNEYCDKNIIIVSVNNVFSHNTIAEYLFDLGYQYVIYKNISGEYNTQFDFIWGQIEKNKIDYEYSKNKIFGSSIKKILPTDEGKNCTGKIKIQDEYIDIYLPIYFLYTMNEEKYRSLHSRADWAQIPYERSVYYYLYCQKLYEFFDVGMSDAEWSDYLISYGQYFKNADVFSDERLEEEFNRHLSQRYSIFLNMERMYSEKTDFFENSPIVIEWNEKRNILCVLDGSNRLGYLIAKGEDYCWCRISHQDYKKWINEGVVKKIKKETLLKYGLEIYGGIYDKRERKNNFLPNKYILKYLGNEKFLDCKRTGMFFSRDIMMACILYKMGITFLIDQSFDFRCDIEDEIFQILYMKDFLYLSNVDKKEIDVILFDSSVDVSIDKVIDIIRKYKIKLVIVLDESTYTWEDFAQNFEYDIKINFRFWDDKSLSGQRNLIIIEKC